MLNFYNCLFFLLYKFAKRINDAGPKFYACIGLMCPLLFMIIILLKLCWIFELFEIDREGLKFVVIVGLFFSLCIFLLQWSYFIHKKVYLQLEELNEKKSEKILSSHTFFYFVVLSVLAATAMFLPINLVEN